MGSRRILIVGGTAAAALEISRVCREAGFTVERFGEACKRAGTAGLELNDVWFDEFQQISENAYRDKLRVTAPVDKRPYFRRFEKRKR